MGTCLLLLVTYILLLTATTSGLYTHKDNEYDETPESPVDATTSGLYTHKDNEYDETPESPVDASTTVEKTTTATSKMPPTVTVGSRVVRGKDWEWDNQDGGPGGKGIVTYIEDYTDWVSVHWDNGNFYNYRMGDEGKYDLSLADDQSPIETSTINEKTTAATSKMPLTGPELAALITVGSRVVRGKDWEWDNQDGGPGGKGIVTNIGVYTDWVSVRWDNGNSHNYRMGDRGKYDLSLADDQSPTETSTTNEKTTAATSKMPLTGPELAALITVGSRVVRGKDWEWDNQDGGPGGIGNVTQTEIYPGWVSVLWDTGSLFNYRMGHHKKYDLYLADPQWTAKVTTTSKTESTNVTEPPTVTVINKISGSVLAVPIKIGTRVVRGRDWEYGNQDGGPGGIGTVNDKIEKGWFTIRWDNGKYYNYRMGKDGKYDLKVLDNASMEVNMTSPSTSTTTTTERASSKLTITTTEMMPSTVTTTMEKMPSTLTTTTETMPLKLTTTPIGTTLPSLNDNIHASNNLFGLLVAKEISNVPRKDRIQTMQDILEVFKKYSKWY